MESGCYRGFVKQIGCKLLASELNILMKKLMTEITFMKMTEIQMMKLWRLYQRMTLVILILPQAAGGFMPEAVTNQNK